MQAKDGTELEGLDISEYQVLVDENMFFTNSPHYNIFRAYGSNHSAPDTQFITRVGMSISHGVPSGAYYFGTPKASATIVADAEAEAQQFIDVLYSAYGQGNVGDIIPMLDVEEYTDIATGTAGYPMASGMTGDQFIIWVKAFRDYFWNATGRRLGFYSNRYFLEDATQMALTLTQLTEISDMPLWLAEYDQWYGGTTGNVQPADLGGWTKWHLWQYAVVADADQYGLSHGQNQVDHNRLKEMSWLLPPPPVNEFSLSDLGSGSLRVDVTHPTIQDYTGVGIYVNGSFKAWLDRSTDSITLNGQTTNTQLEVYLISEDEAKDIAQSDSKFITLVTVDSPNVTIVNLQLTKLSDEIGFQQSDVTFSFDKPVLAYSVRCNGTSHDTGIVVGEDNKYVISQSTLTIAEASIISVRDFRLYDTGLEITETIDYTELYSEGSNRINFYGKSENGNWTIYDQS